MTAFVAFVTMDANRQKTGRMDWCCCFIDQASIDEVIKASVVFLEGVLK